MITGKGIGLHKQNEWTLLAEFKDALKEENYEYCQRVQVEIKRRIADKTLHVGLAIDGFRDIGTGVIDFREYAPLFEGVKDVYPEHFTRKAEMDFLLSIYNYQAKRQIKGLL